MIAGGLCVLVMVFMIAEAGHSHPPAGTLHHTFCYWCSAAHVASIRSAAVPPLCAEFTQPLVLPQELREHALLLVPPEPVRPPPPLQKDRS